MDKYIIGIDLGTTNSTLAYCTYAENSQVAEIQQFAIPQKIKSDQVENLLSLPSFLYFYLPEEKSKESEPYTIGLFARNRGAELPHHLIASAKSWLCNAGISREEKCLPLDADAPQKMSPRETCTAILSHIRTAWNEAMPKASFNKQTVLITVPASFDPAARELVLEAAKQADYPSVVLLEEPQAAFYSWLQLHEEAWRKQLKIGDKVLVIDIGGGTTDFSLISVESQDGNLHLSRLAVGAHLLLGGDNLDLAIAYLAKAKLEEHGHAIDEWQMQSLTHSARAAKECLLGENPPNSYEIILQGRGSRLIGNTLKTSVSKEEIDSLVLDGFFPLIDPSVQSKNESRGGLRQIGLLYAQDPRITAQLAKFLSMTGEVDNGSLEKFIMPTAVLFNGGTLHAAAIRKRLLTQLNAWAEYFKAASVQELPGCDLDFAVSRGAVYYGFAREGKAIRIKSSSSKSYFIGIEDAAPAVPGMVRPMKAICIVPYGMEEGSEEILGGKEFVLTVGEPATFKFFSHSTPWLSTNEKPVVGTVVKNWKQELTELQPIETVLESKEGDPKVLPVTLKSVMTEVGTLELWCQAQDGRKWKLQFETRKS